MREAGRGHPPGAGVVRRRTLALGLLILASSLALFYPYVVNHRYIVAAAHADDDFYVYNAVVNNLPYFANDIFAYLVPCFVKGTLLNWGALWLVNTVGIPIAAVSLSLSAVMLFMLPLLYLFLVRKHVAADWLPFIFLAGLLCHHYTWNLSNHGMVDLPYRPHIAIPVIFLGILLLINEHRYGYLVVAFGITFHVPMGLYALLTVALWQVVHYRRVVSSNTLLLAPLIAAAAIPSISVLSQDYPAVSQADLLSLYRFNMHFYPWNSPFRWPQSLSVVVAFALLATLAFPRRRSLGAAYGNLVTASVAATAILCLSHLAGIAFQLPALITVCGLRSVAFLAVVMLPIILLRLIDLVAAGSVTEQTLAAFALLCLVVGRPYGLYAFPGLLLLIQALAGKLSEGRPAKVLQAAARVMTASWFAAWLVFSVPPGALLARRLAPDAGHGLATFVLPVVADAAPALSRLPALVAAAGLLLSVLALAQRTFQVVPRAHPFLLTVAALLFLGHATRQTLQQTGNQQARDLYAAQVWAREHTARGDLFIVFDGSWRAFSERPAFVPANLGYYMYLPDQRIKTFDDFVFRFYGIADPYRTYDQKTLLALVQKSYRRLNETDFSRLAAAVNARYLVETRPLGLPLAYRNTTYYLYGPFPKKTDGQQTEREDAVRSGAPPRDPHLRPTARPGPRPGLLRSALACGRRLWGYNALHA